MSRLVARAPRNRVLAARMRDDKRWVYAYREAAWDAAVEEARHRSFFSSIVYAAAALLGSWGGRPMLSED